jgi:hypothetical protein
LPPILMAVDKFKLRRQITWLNFYLLL